MFVFTGVTSLRRTKTGLYGRGEERSLEPQQKGNLLCLYLLHKYIHLEVPNDHDCSVHFCKTLVRDLLHPSVAKNQTPPIVPVVSASLRHWTKLTPSPHECSVIHPHSHSASQCVCLTCGKHLEPKEGFHCHFPGIFSAFLVALSDIPGINVRSDLFLGPCWHL